jgi:hypothetical protein
MIDKSSETGKTDHYVDLESAYSCIVNKSVNLFQYRSIRWVLGRDAWKQTASQVTPSQYHETDSEPMQAG